MGGKTGKHVLLVSDLAGYGKVALSAMFPILSHMGLNLYNLPTALVSNTFCYAKAEVLDTTGYLKRALALWKEMGVRFDAVATGYLYSLEQAEVVLGFCLEQRERGSLVFTDPIMADEGELYMGLDNRTVETMRRIIPVSDFLLPNYTEACLLSGVPYRGGPIDDAGLDGIVDALRSLGARSVVVTSALSKTRGPVVVGYDHRRGRRFAIPYEHIPVFFPGTGDIFSSVFIGRILEGHDVEASTLSAMRAVYGMILANRDNEDKNRGINIEESLDVINRTAPARS